MINVLQVLEEINSNRGLSLLQAEVWVNPEKENIHHAEEWCAKNTQKISKPLNQAISHICSLCLNTSKLLEVNVRAGRVTATVEEVIETDQALKAFEKFLENQLGEDFSTLMKVFPGFIADRRGGNEVMSWDGSKGAIFRHGGWSQSKSLLRIDELFLKELRTVHHQKLMRMLAGPVMNKIQDFDLELFPHLRPLKEAAAESAENLAADSRLYPVVVPASSILSSYKYPSNHGEMIVINRLYAHASEKDLQEKDNIIFLAPAAVAYYARSNTRAVVSSESLTLAQFEIVKSFFEEKNPRGNVKLNNLLNRCIEIALAV